MAEDENLEITVVEQEKEDPTARRKALVTDWIHKIRSAKGHFQHDFDKMRRDMDAALNGFDDTEWSDDNYVANILQRHVQQRTASLYAKNPKAQAKRRDRLDYAVWDGDEKTLMMAYQARDMATQQQMPIPVEAIAIIEDFKQTQNQRKMLDNVAKTLEHLFDYFMKEQQPTFKSQMKGLVRRVITTGVGFVKVGFQRDMDRQPEISQKLTDVQARLDYLRRIAQQAADGDIKEDDAEIEALMLSMNALMEEPLITVREGLVFDFPESNSIIVCLLYTSDAADE